MSRLLFVMRTLTRIKRQFQQDHLMQRVIKNSGIVLFGNSMASALNLISFIIMARKLGPESLALLVLAQTYALILNDIFNIQTWESMVKFGFGGLLKGDIANVIKTNFILDVISAMAAFVFALILARPVVHILGWDTSLINIISLYSLSILFNITTLTIGIPRLFNKFFDIARIQVAMACLKFGCILYIVYFSKSFMCYLGIYLFIDILTNVLIIMFSMKLLGEKLESSWWKQNIRLDRSQIKFIWWTNLRTIIRVPIRHFDMIVISFIMSIKMVGVYKVYKEVAGLINRVGDPVNQVIFPEFTKLIGDNDTKKSINTAKKTILLLAGVSAAITVVLLLISKIFVGRFFGAEYLTELVALYIMLILFGVSFVLVPINSLFIAAGFAKYSFYLVLFTNTIYLLTAFSFGKLYGIYGVIAAYGVQMILNQGLKIFLLYRYPSEWSSTIR